MSRELRVLLTKGVTTSQTPVRTKKEMARETKYRSMEGDRDGLKSNL